MNLTGISIYYDGMDIQKYSTNPHISGFTTNCTVFSKCTEKNYKEYYNSIKENIGNKSLSFQIWENNILLAKKQIDSIYDISSTLFVKIPIINISGEYNDELYKYAMSKNMNINITCLYTIEQISHAWDLFKNYRNNIIVSVFAGPISDTGVDPDPYILHAVDLFEPNSKSKILWAGCREIYSIKRACDLGCHIITAPDTVIDKLSSLTKDLTIASIERVKMFYNDAVKSRLVC